MKTRVEDGRGWMEALREQAKERGLLFSVVSAWCVMLGALCVAAGAAAFLKSLWGQGANGEAVLRMICIGAFILASTAWMWTLSKWGRNIAVVATGTLSWILGEWVSRRTGAGIEAQVMTVLFVATAMSCFTSPRVRRMYARAAEEAEE